MCGKRRGRGWRRPAVTTHEERPPEPYAVLLRGPIRQPVSLAARVNNSAAMCLRGDENTQQLRLACSCSEESKQHATGRLEALRSEMTGQIAGNKAIAPGTVYLSSA